MLCFFYLTEDVTVNILQKGIQYVHNFKGTMGSEISSSKIHITTPSDYNKICSSIKSSGKNPDICKLINPEEIMSHEYYPENITFKEIIEDTPEFIKGKKQVKVAIMNGISNAFGDYIVGLNAFSLYQDKLKEKYPDVEFKFSLFQLNPHKFSNITMQWSHLCSCVSTMPINLSRFLSHDVYIDFGALLLYENFSNQPMFDFFLEAFSPSLKNVPLNQKRLKYTPSDESDSFVKILMKHIRSVANGKKIILLHPLASSPVRTMPKKHVLRLVSELTENNYFVISAVDIREESLDSNDNYMDIHKFSAKFDELACIVKYVDGIVSVDTSVVHLSDCFNTPTVAFFTTINPKYRACYYPNVKSIMLEKEDGFLYGKLKLDPKDELADSTREYVSELWDKIKIEEIMSYI